MGAALGLLVVGAVVLYVGAETAIRGATRLAHAAGIPAFLLGAVLFGVDIEGLGTAIVAAGRGQTQIAAGEIFGTVLFLFSVAFGLALLVARDPVPAPPPLMVVAPAVSMIAAAAALFDHFVSRPEGGFLLALYVLYLVFVVRESRAAQEQVAETKRESGGGANSQMALITLGGLALLYVGATLLVSGGSRLVDRTTLSAGFVGAALVGTLASLDEVLLEILPIRRGTPDLATGNLFGTLAAFTTGVLGLAAIVRPLDVDGAANAAFLGMAFLYAVVSTVLLARGRAGRLLGVFVIGFYVLWLVLTATV
jgi:cation:H+ antiporter